MTVYNPSLHRALTTRGWTEGPQGCWLITGRTNNSGYCSVSNHCQPVLAHRAAYEAWVGDIPEGLVVRHKCDVRRCINPRHLEVGTHQQNVQDAVDRGRVKAGDAHHWTKISEDDARELKELYNTGDWTQEELANRYGVTRPAISHRLGKTRLSKRLSPDEVREIRLLKDQYSRVQLGKMYGVAASTISQVVNNRSWKGL